MSEKKVWQESLGNYPRIVAEFEVEPEKTALVVVDMQYYDAHPDYGMGRILKERYPELAAHYLPRLRDLVIPNCIKLVDFFRKHQLKLFYASFGATLPDGSDSLPLRKLRDEEIERETGVKSTFPLGSFEHQVLEELKPRPEEIVVNKTTRSAFSGTGLDHTLRMMGVDSVIVIGALTNGCVESTGRSASDLGYKTIVIDDASATIDQASQDATMKAFAWIFGKVMDTDELIANLSKKLDVAAVAAGT